MLVPGPFPPSPPKTVKLGPYQIRRRWWRWRRGRNLLFLRGRAMAIAPFQNRKPHCCYWAAGHGLLLLFVRFIFPCFIAPLFLLLLLLLPVLSSRAENHTENTHTHTSWAGVGDRIFPLTCIRVQLHLSAVTVAEYPTWCSHQPVWLCPWFMSNCHLAKVL